MNSPRVWAEINLDRLSRNLAWVRSLLPSTCKLLAVVKADAYGHGSAMISRALGALGIDMLGVGNADEGIALRLEGVEVPILVLGGVTDGEIDELIVHGITPTVHSPERIELFEESARKQNTRVGVHLLVDTGMGRLGVSVESVTRHAQAIARSPDLVLDGVGTHLATPCEPGAAVLQLAAFDRALSSLVREGLLPPVVHVVSSRGLLRFPERCHDMVRIGGLLYGLIDQGGVEATSPEPVLALRTQVIYLRDLPAGTPVGYDGSYQTPRPTRLATLPVGYHDGYTHCFSNSGEVLVRGRRAPVRGRVTMDYLSVDVTDIPGVRVGDTTTLLGKDGPDEIFASDLARWSGGVLYEFPSLLGRRVLRRYSGFETTASCIERGSAPMEKQHP